MPRYRGEPYYTPETYPAPPAEPFLFNDPRITYNEPCFAYNGGFDLICLFGRKTRGPIVGGKSRHIYPNPEIMEVFFQTCYKKRDDLDEQQACEVKKYTVNKKIDATITSDIISIDVKKKSVEATVTKYVNKISKGMETNVEFVNNLTPSVSSSLKLQIPRKIIFKTERIK
jgi:hypothetical protein